MAEIRSIAKCICHFVRAHGLQGGALRQMKLHYLN